MMNSREMNDLKERLDILFNFSSQVSYSEGHLLPVVQACKTLLGISSNQISHGLLRWLDGHVKNFTPNSDFTYDLNSTVSVELLSTFELENMIMQNDRDKAEKYLHHLIQVSDPRYLMEILFEISLNHGNKEILFCWAAYKTVKFMDPENSIPILFIALDCLLEKNKNLKGKKVLLSFYVYCHSCQILKTDMVRIKKISSKLIHFRENRDDFSTIFSRMPASLLKLLASDKEDGFGKYLFTIKTSDINEEHLFLLDAIRALYNYADESDDVYRSLVNVC